MPQHSNYIVYIVDDDESIRRAYKRMIQSADIEAKAFASAREFLDAGCSQANACLVVDAKMPEMSGLELKQELDKLGSTIPVILVTAFDNVETREQAKKIGIDHYFSKPLDSSALLDTIRWLLEGRTA
jgi:FixJ family two-component response regulator